MSLLQEWRDVAYSEETNSRNGGREFWQPYFLKETPVYEKFLATPSEQPKMTLKEFSDAFDLGIFYATGIVDGMNESLKNPVDIENMTEETEIDFSLDLEKLYKNMVDARAEWLYELPAWDNIFTKEERRKLYLEQKASNTVVKGKKIGRNDPCPCGSGKKYKQCCGR